MAFFEKIGGKITSTSKEVAKKTMILADIAKINLQISGEEDNIKSLNAQIGKLYYELFSASPDERFTPLCNSIKESLDKIEGYKNQLYILKGVKRCTNCGTEISNSTLICGTCGHKAVEFEESETNGQLQLKCPSCNTIVSEEAVFCTNCGTKLK